MRGQVGLFPKWLFRLHKSFLALHKWLEEMRVFLLRLYKGLLEICNSSSSHPIQEEKQTILRAIWASEAGICTRFGTPSI